MTRPSDIGWLEIGPGVYESTFRMALNRHTYEATYMMVKHRRWFTSNYDVTAANSRTLVKGVTMERGHVIALRNFAEMVAYAEYPNNPDREVSLLVQRLLSSHPITG